MSADEVRGPRHAAPKKPLFTRFHVPSGKAIALAAMPTAVLMGMGFTPTLALADGNDGTPTANSLTVDEYQACLEVAEAAKKGDASASPTPSASASESASPDGEPSAETSDEQKAPEADKGTEKETSSSSDSGSDDKDEPAPATSAPAAEDTAEPEPEPSETDRNLLEGLGDALKDVFTPKEKEAEASPTPSASATEDDEAGDAAGTAKETTEKVTETAKDTAEDAGDKATKAAEDTKETVEEATEEATETLEATASPSPSESAKIDPEDCPIATDAEGGVDNQLLLPDDPWTLNASSLLLKGASYEGIVEVRTASGGTKRVLKYVISGGTDIGDLHQTVEDKRSGATHHVQAAKGSTSTIRDGDTVMYTESISGNLLGLIPVTFDPEHPPPLDIPLIYFTKVTVKQAGQFGGTLHVPGLQQYITTG
ncbi:hypothetical protein ACFUIT_14730 [Streptomyces sp. NPDC057239]|uniref:hypothetical protein n=1 Tax=Streptomyces sp. NPDC057239 TaxID=3346061 RepID=UPI00362C4150